MNDLQPAKSLTPSTRRYFLVRLLHIGPPILFLLLLITVLFFWNRALAFDVRHLVPVLLGTVVLIALVIGWDILWLKAEWGIVITGREINGPDALGMFRLRFPRRVSILFEKIDQGKTGDLKSRSLSGNVIWSVEGKAIRLHEAFDSEQLHEIAKLTGCSFKHP